MNLKIVIENNVYTIQVPEDVMSEGANFFEKMDRDMDRGWQMNREWVTDLNQAQRCQIAADRIADAMATENETLVHLMAGYILTSMPNIKEVHICTDGDMTETQLIFE